MRQVFGFSLHKLETPESDFYFRTYILTCFREQSKQPFILIEKKGQNNLTLLT